MLNPIDLFKKIMTIHSSILFEMKTRYLTNISEKIKPIDIFFKLTLFEYIIDRMVWGDDYNFCNALVEMEEIDLKIIPKQHMWNLFELKKEQGFFDSIDKESYKAIVLLLKDFAKKTKSENELKKFITK